jgi:hypothetical protein
MIRTTLLAKTSYIGSMKQLVGTAPRRLMGWFVGSISVAAVFSLIADRVMAQSPSSTTELVLQTSTEPVEQVGAFGGEQYGGVARIVKVVLSSNQAMKDGRVIVPLSSGEIEPSSLQVRSMDRDAEILQVSLMTSNVSPAAHLRSLLGQAVVISTSSTSRAEISGVLRSFDDEWLSIETTGPQLRLLRRGTYVQEVKAAIPQPPRTTSIAVVTMKAKAGRKLSTNVGVMVDYTLSSVGWRHLYSAILDRSNKTILLSEKIVIENSSTESVPSAMLSMADHPQQKLSLAHIPAGSIATLHAGDKTTAVTPVQVVMPNTWLTATPASWKLQRSSGTVSTDCEREWEDSGVLEGWQWQPSGGELSEMHNDTVQLAGPPSSTAPLPTAAQRWSAPGYSPFLFLQRSSSLTVQRSSDQCDVDQNGHMLKETLSVELRNSSTAPVTVQLREAAERGGRFSIQHMTPAGGKITSEGVMWNAITIPANATTTVSYDIVYRW